MESVGMLDFINLGDMLHIILGTVDPAVLKEITQWLNQPEILSNVTNIFRMLLPALGK
jgi:hypothetical protein